MRFIRHANKHLHKMKLNSHPYYICMNIVIALKSENTHILFSLFLCSKCIYFSEWLYVLCWTEFLLLMQLLVAGCSFSHIRMMRNHRIVGCWFAMHTWFPACVCVWSAKLSSSKWKIYCIICIKSYNLRKSEYTIKLQRVHSYSNKQQWSTTYERDRESRYKEEKLR